MTNFEQLRKEAQKVFFKKKNWYESADFMFDILEGKLIPISEIGDTSHGSYISFTEYSYVFNDYRIIWLIDLLTDEIKYKHNHSKEFLDGAKKEFDNWFKDFYETIINYSKEKFYGDLTKIGTHIAFDYMEYCENHEDSHLF